MEAQNFGTPTLRYDFDTLPAGVLTDGASITNLGSVGGAGIFDTGFQNGTGNIVATGIVTTIAYGAVNFGNTLTLTPAADGNGNLDSTNIDAGAPVGSTGFGIQPNTDYTAFAWINFANQNGDNMVFGGIDINPDPNINDPSLHLGSRANQYHSGHWGDDLTSGTTDPGNWHLVAYTNVGSTGAQTIYVDPDSASQQIFGPNGGFGQMNTTKNLYIGTFNNDGSFNGQLDAVSVYNTVLTPAEIHSAATVPEPGTFAAIAGGATLLLGLRRRRH